MNTKQRFDVDPILEKISHHLPDEEINVLFPFKKFNTQGRSREFKTSQLYRAHILAMLKGIHSFNPDFAYIDIDTPDVYLRVYSGSDFTSSGAIRSSIE
jgi:hypothetical protein